MIQVLEGVRPGAHELLEQAFRLRHSIFAKEKGWSNVAGDGGREVDEFDTEHAVYLLAVSNGIVRGNLRILPTTRPHLLSRIHSHLATREYPTGPHVWEWTRFCIDQNFRGDAAIGKIAAELTLGAVEWGLSRGVLEVVVEFDPFYITRFREFGFDVRLLGLPVEMDGDPVVAVHLRYDESVLLRIRKVTRIDYAVLRDTADRAPAAPEAPVASVPQRLLRS
jgi:acyl-homoserine lactone synthase